MKWSTGLPYVDVVFGGVVLSVPVGPSVPVLHRRSFRRSFLRIGWVAGGFTGGGRAAPSGCSGEVSTRNPQPGLSVAWRDAWRERMGGDGRFWHQTWGYGTCCIQSLYVSHVIALLWYAKGMLVVQGG